VDRHYSLSAIDNQGSIGSWSGQGAFLICPTASTDATRAGVSYRPQSGWLQEAPTMGMQVGPGGPAGPVPYSNPRRMLPSCCGCGVAKAAGPGRRPGPTCAPGSRNAEDRKPWERQSLFESHRQRRWFTSTGIMWPLTEGLHGILSVRVRSDFGLQLIPQALNSGFGIMEAPAGLSERVHHVPPGGRAHHSAPQ